MRLTLAVPALILVLTVAGASAAKPGDASYLTDQGAPDMVRILPPPPPPGGPEDQADKQIFTATRALEGTPRWQLAISDADEGAILADLSCAAGVTLSAQATPHLAALIDKMRPDVSRGGNAPKTYYLRPRPFFSLPDAICTPRGDNISADYPSGHASWGWAVGLVLAELDPDRATEILTRARAFGESRVVCGVHNASSVEASRTVASSVVAALHGSADFRADMDAARAELASLRAAAGPAPAPAACAVESDLTAHTPWRP
jgi:acid phosphatase (class A)